MYWLIRWKVIGDCIDTIPDKLHFRVTLPHGSKVIPIPLSAGTINE